MFYVLAKKLTKVTAAFSCVSHFSCFVLALRSYYTPFKNTFLAGHGWCIPVLPELWRLRQVDYYDFKASLGYTVSVRSAYNRLSC